MAMLRPVSEMKDSGIEWIGIIPEFWNIQRLKYLVTHLTVKADNNEGYIGLENVESFSGKFVSGVKEVFEAEGVSLAVKKGDLIFGKLRPYLAKCAIVEEDGCCSTEFVVMRANKCLERYLKYIILSPMFIDSVNMSTYGTKMPRANWDFIGNMIIPFPPLEEQQAIASYLDDRCSRLDEIITEAEKSIEEYKELKQAVIANTVLYGVHKDVQLRNSGENWCKTIPSHWRFERGKYLFKETNIRSVDGTEELLTVSQYTGITPRSMKNVTMFEAASLVDYKICEVGDIAANTMWMWAGAVGVSEYYGVISPSYNTYRQTRGDFDSKYLDYLLRAVPLVSEYESLSTGIRASRLRLYPSQFLSIRYPVPPMDEQKEIVEYLNRKIGDMDALISEKQSLIEDLKAYKKSLIYEVVTGKRRVV